MTSHYYITGTSRGLGRALVETLVRDEDASVTSIGRSAGPDVAGYEHVELDLINLDAVAAFRFPNHGAPDRVILVNNAAVLNARYLHEETAESIQTSYAVNIVAPVLLTNAFLAAYRDAGVEMVVCNVSSRSSQVVLPGATLYSGTKAAMDITSRTLAAEAKASGVPLTVLCVNPGSIDTAMQETLRSADETRFPFAITMRKTKAEGRLQTPQSVAERLVRVLKDPALAPDVVFTLADVSA